MKGYKVYNMCRMGFEGDISYFATKNKALQEFNNLLRKEVRENDVLTREDFSQEVKEMKEYNEDWNLICRTYPVIMFENETKLRGHVPYWENTSYEYNEYEIEANSIILEEIELIE
jgi:hypothetical protein